MTKDLPSPELLRKLLRYEPETGKLFWRERPAEMFPGVKYGAAHSANMWNTRFAGKEAFTAYADGYKAGSLFGRKYKAHRVIWAISYNQWPDQIDHMNGVQDDNRLENLRNVSHVENGRNQRKSIANTSGVTGVCWRDRDKKWVAKIKVAGHSKHLGHFDDKDIAIAARKAAEAHFGFHFNHGKEKGFG
jgi:hypothetical protein